MTPAWVAVVAAVAAAAGGAVSALITAIRQRGADKQADWASYTDDLHAEIVELRKRMGEQDKSIGDLWAARREDQAVIGAALGHIALLERGIVDGSVPPLPPRPKILGGA